MLACLRPANSDDVSAGVIAQGVGIWTLPLVAVTLALLQMAAWWRLVERMRVARPDLATLGPDEPAHGH